MVAFSCELINAYLQLAMAKKEHEMTMTGKEEEESSQVLQFNGEAMNHVAIINRYNFVCADNQELVAMTNDTELQSLVNFESGDRPGSATDQRQMSYGMRAGW